MTTKDNGGPAFPVSDEQSDNGISATPGMTLRDYFAAAAIQGMFAADTAESVMPNINKARLAYVMADEMLKARNA